MSAGSESEGGLWVQVSVSAGERECDSACLCSQVACLCSACFAFCLAADALLPPPASHPRLKGPAGPARRLTRPETARRAECGEGDADATRGGQAKGSTGHMGRGDDTQAPMVSGATCGVRARRACVRLRLRASRV